jgi:hypothetical protein
MHAGLREHLGVPAPSDTLLDSGNDSGPDANTTVPINVTICTAAAVSNAAEWIEGIVLDDSLLLQSLMSGPARGQGYPFLLFFLTIIRIAQES